MSDALRARALLSKVISLIEKDVLYIETDLSSGKLDKDSSADLVRYSSALLSILKDKEAHEEKGKKSLEKMTDAELLEMAEKAIRDLKGKDDEHKDETI